MLVLEKEGNKKVTGTGNLVEKRLYWGSWIIETTMLRYLRIANNDALKT
jgi:hypothetical protein